MSEDIISKLRQLCAESDASRRFFELLAARKNNPTSTKVDLILRFLLREGMEVTRQEIIEIMKGLQALGLGEFIPGRHSKPSRFAWARSAIEVGQVATGESEKIDLSGTGFARDPIDGDADEDEFREHQFHLRPDFVASIELPVDLTPLEAERLAAFVKTLPLAGITPP